MSVSDPSQPTGPPGPTLDLLALRDVAHELADLADARSLAAYESLFAPGAPGRGVVDTKADGTPEIGRAHV